MSESATASRSGDSLSANQRKQAVRSPATSGKASLGYGMTTTLFLTLPSEYSLIHTSQNQIHYRRSMAKAD